MIEGAESAIPVPIEHAADAIIQAAPVFGPIIVSMAAAIAAMAFYITRLHGQLAEAKSAHIADLKLNIPAMHELRETILAEVRNRRGSRA